MRRSFYLFSPTWYARISFILSNDYSYTNDSHGHIEYIKYVIKSWQSPYAYTGGEFHQPPLYYYVAAFLIKLCRSVVAISGFTLLRSFSWVSYLVFMMAGVLIIRRALLCRSAYYIAVTMLLFWPAGMHIGTRISNEPFYYAFYAIAFYHLIVWYHEGCYSRLCLAWLIAGIAFTVRTNIIILMMIMLVLMAVAWQRREFRVGEFFHKGGMRLILPLLLCFLLVIPKYLGPDLEWQPPDNYMGNNNVLPLMHYIFLAYDASMNDPYVRMWEGYPHQSFWDIVLKTSIFGEAHWPWPQIGAVMYATLLLLALYTLSAWWSATRQEIKGMLPYITGFFIPLGCLLVYATSRNYFSSQDTRFIYPFLICFCVLFAKSVQFYQFRGALSATIVGYGLAITFCLLSIFFFVNVTR